MFVNETASFHIPESAYTVAANMSECGWYKMFSASNDNFFPP